MWVCKEMASSVTLLCLALHICILLLTVLASAYENGVIPPNWNTYR